MPFSKCSNRFQGCLFQLATAAILALGSFPATAATITDANVPTWVFQGEPMAITADGREFGNAGTLNVKVTPKSGGTAVFPIQAPNPGRWLFSWRDRRIELGFSPLHTSQMTVGKYTFQLEARPASGSAPAQSRKFDILVLPRIMDLGVGRLEFAEKSVALVTAAFSPLLEQQLVSVPFKVRDNSERVIDGVGFKINEGKSQIKKAEVVGNYVAIDLEVEVKVKVDSRLAKWSGSISVAGRAQLRPEARNDNVYFKTATDGFRLKDTGSMPGAIKGIAEKYLRRFADDFENQISRLALKAFDDGLNKLAREQVPIFTQLHSCWKRGFLHLDVAQLQDREFRLGYGVILDPDGRGFACIADLPLR